MPEDKAREMERRLEKEERKREDRHPERGQTFIQLQHFTSWRRRRSWNERGGGRQTAETKPNPTDHCQP